MAFRNYVELTDPKVMRALAHPARTAILAYLQDHGPATATECSAVAEESPSSCSYHLRRLAQLGFVGEVPSDDGRERRWTSLISGYGIPKEAQDRPEVLAAMRPLVRRWVEYNERVIGDYLAREKRFDPSWRKAATFQQTNPRVTPAELIRIQEQILEVFKPFQERERPPESAERVYASFVAVPWPLERRTKRAGQRVATASRGRLRGRAGIGRSRRGKQ
jgi:DNA-binding transcriptional ArsR family regulator